MKHSTGLGNLRNISYWTNDGNNPNAFRIFPFPEEHSKSPISLRAATIGGVEHLECGNNFPLQQLISLCLDLYEGRLDLLLCEVLTHCHALERFELTLGQDYFGMEIEEIEAEGVMKDSIIIPHLATLILHNFMTYSMYILPFLRLPALRCLKIDHLQVSPLDEDDDSTYLAILLNFIARSSCSLTQLPDLRYSGAKEGIARLFRATPALECLSIDLESCEEEDLLFLFSKSSNGDILCPALKQLTLYLRNPTLSMSTVVSKIVESRINEEFMPATTQFWLFRIILPDIEHTEFANALTTSLEKFTSEGFDLDIVIQ